MLWQRERGVLAVRHRLVMAKRSRAVLVGFGAVACALLAACSASAATSSSTAGKVSVPAVSSSTEATTVTLHGVSMTLPTGWSQGTPTLCGPVVQDTVTVYTGAPTVASCPTTAGASKDVEAVSLVEVFGPWGAMPWTGTKTVWDGQPVWVTTYDATGAPVDPCPSDPGAVVASYVVTQTG